MEQAIGALLNLAVSEELREEMGKRGTIKMMMGRLRQVSYWQATNLSDKTVISVAMVTTSVVFIFSSLEVALGGFVYSCVTHVTNTLPKAAEIIFPSGRVYFFHIRKLRGHAEHKQL